MMLSSKTLCACPRVACHPTAQLAPKAAITRRRHSSLARAHLILGIESSCDDTGAAVVSSDGYVLGEALATQAEIHAPWGGVVPQLAKEAHQSAIDSVVSKALSNANIIPSQLSAIAVTVGPGLSLCLRVGVIKALSMSSLHALPLIRVHHMEAHALVARMIPGGGEVPRFPFLCLLVSGGHNLLVLVRGVGDYVQLGTTLDDALGEAYDKIARMLDLDLNPSGGAALEALARKGDPHAFKFVLPMKQRPSCDFSYAGLKTSVRLAIEANVPKPSSAPPPRQPYRPSNTAAQQQSHAQQEFDDSSEDNQSLPLGIGMTETLLSQERERDAGDRGLVSCSASNREGAGSTSSTEGGKGHEEGSTIALLGIDRDSTMSPVLDSPLLERPAHSLTQAPNLQQRTTLVLDLPASTQEPSEISKELGDGEGGAGRGEQPGSNGGGGGGEREGVMQTKANIAASFQHMGTLHLVDRLKRGIRWARSTNPDIQHLVVAGGVACNQHIRAQLSELSSQEGLTLVVPPPKWCTDNGVMVAWAGVERMALGLTEPPQPPGLEFTDDSWVDLKPRWPLTVELHPECLTPEASGSKAAVRALHRQGRWRAGSANEKRGQAPLREGAQNMQGGGEAACLEKAPSLVEGSQGMGLRDGPGEGQVTGNQGASSGDEGVRLESGSTGQSGGIPGKGVSPLHASKSARKARLHTSLSEMTAEALAARK